MRASSILRRSAMCSRWDAVDSPDVIESPDEARGPSRLASERIADTPRSKSAGLSATICGIISPDDDATASSAASLADFAAFRAANSLRRSSSCAFCDAIDPPLETDDERALERRSPRAEGASLLESERHAELSRLSSRPRGSAADALAARSADAACLRARSVCLRSSSRARFSRTDAEEEVPRERDDVGPSLVASEASSRALRFPSPTGGTTSEPRARCGTTGAEPPPPLVFD